LFADLGPRRLETLFDANWLNMAPADYDGPVIDTFGDPLDRDGDGHKGGDLTDAEVAALAAYGLTHNDWCNLPEDERNDTLQAAVLAAAPGREGDATGEQAPETPQGAAEAPEGGSGTGEAAASAGDPSTAATEADHEASADNSDTAGGEVASEAAPATEGGEATATEGDTVTAPPAIAAYKNFGFGRWYAIDATGKEVGDKVSKDAAAGLAIQAGVPILGQTEYLPGTEPKKA
jgi:hypothetical protein